jgi:hypothetical protein
MVCFWFSLLSEKSDGSHMHSAEHYTLRIGGYQVTGMMPVDA